MLCNSKISNRPDKLLQSSLIKQAFYLVALTIVIILFLTYPEHHFLLLLLTALLTSLCLILTIKTLDAGEEAITYGGFANEIIRNDFRIQRIENPQGESIIQNLPAEDLFKTLPVLDFIEQHLADGTIHKNNFYRLKTAYQNLTKETATIPLILHKEAERVFNDIEWFEVTLQPIYLKKTDIFEGKFSVKAIKKYTYIYWKLENITASKNMEHVFQEERKSLHDFLDYLPVGVYTCNEDYRIEYCNHALANALGYHREEIIGENLWRFLSPHCELPGKHSLWKGTLYLIDSDNETKEYFVAQESFREEKEIKFRGVMINDLPGDTELKANLEHSLDEISWLFNDAPVGIAFIGLDGTIKDCNFAVEKFLDRTKAQIQNKKIFDYIRQEDCEALQKEKQSEMLDKAISDKRSKLNKEKGNQLLGAVADWATGKSKALKGDIEDLKFDLAEAHETIAEERKRTQAETAKLEAYKKTVAQQMESAVRNATLKKDDEINNLKDRISWRDKMLGMFTKILMQSNGTFRKAVDSIINFAKDTYRSIFSREEAKTIKSVMEAFGKNKEDYRAIGTFLVFTADKKENLSNSEYRKAVREVDDVAIGRYEQAQKRGNSLKL